MKIFALFLAIVAIAQAKQTFVTSKALHVRGGGSLGPLDDIVGNMGSAAVASYVGASAAKIVAGQAGGNAPAVADFLTNDTVGTLALAQAIATGAYFIGDTGFGSDVATVTLVGLALALKVNAAGGMDKLGDVIQENRMLTLAALASAYITFL